MKHITTFLLGCFFAISVAATTTNLMTVKPAMPKVVYSERFYDYGGCLEAIRLKTKGGFIVKAIGGGGVYSDGYILVMEKY